MKTLPSETVLYGRKIDAAEWEEQILSTNPPRFDEIKRLAAADGFGHFRIAVIDLSAPPNFAATVSIS
jgi:hypothetical protein